MSVLDQRYRRWTGQQTPYWQRILVIPRYDVLEILSRKLWAAFYIISLVPPALLGVYTYLAANWASVGKLVPLLAKVTFPLPGADAWAVVTYGQLWLIVAFSVLVGPPLATRDFANNALPLYLSKALGRAEYVLGRWAILLALLSAASWLPLSIVFGLEFALAPPTWRADNAWLLGGIFAATIPCVLLLTAMVSAVAAHVHRTNLARAALLGLIMMTWPLGKMLEATTRTPMAQVVSPMAMAVRVNVWAFTPAQPVDERAILETLTPAAQPARDTMVPGPLAFAVLVAWFLACIAVLALRVRPVEVVK